MEQFPVIYLALSVGAFSAGAVEPLFKHGAVAGKGALQRLAEHLVIGLGAVGRVVAVPRGDIDAEFDSLLCTGLGKLFEHVSPAAAPGTLPYGVLGYGIGPEAETVVVFAGDDDALEAGGFGRTRPLAAVQVRRVEEVFGLRSLSPFQAGESVGAEVAEHIQFHILPFQLLRGGNGTEGLFLRCAGGGQ